MSYAFDVMGQVWRERIRPLVEDDTLATEFEMLMEAMHSANHQVPSADGVFKGDGVNKSKDVTRQARELEQHHDTLGKQGKKNA